MSDHLVLECPECKVLRKIPHDWETLIDAKADAIDVEWDQHIWCNDDHDSVIMDISSEPDLVSIVMFAHDDTLLIHLNEGKAHCVLHQLWVMYEPAPGSLFCLCEECSFIQRHALG